MAKSEKLTMDNRHKVTQTLPINQEEARLIRNTVAKGATEDELKLFLYQAKRTGLDPLARQIYFVKRNMKNGTQVTIQTSIDGFRIIAERSGLYAGQDAPEFEEIETKLIKCSVRVYKFSPTNERYLAAVGVAYWDEYKPSQGQDFMWNKMPHVMLSKVAEALALRKAFPQDLSGIYTSDEMNQAEMDDSSEDGNTHKYYLSDSNPSISKKVNENKICPNCKRPMVIREGKFGSFWGCTGYPECKHIENI